MYTLVIDVNKQIVACVQAAVRPPLHDVYLVVGELIFVHINIKQYIVFTGSGACYATPTGGKIQWRRMGIISICI